MATTTPRTPARPATSKAADKPAATRAAAAGKATPAKSAAAPKATAARTEAAEKVMDTAKATTRRAAVAKSESARPAPQPARKTSPTAEGPGSDHATRAWELAKKIGICMFVTWDGERQRARPLGAHVDRDAHAVYFLTSVSGQKDDQVERFPTVTLAFADHVGSKYVTITGQARVGNDRALIKKLWTPFARAWWDSPEDPAIRVITVTPEDAELWETPGGIVSSGIRMVTAAITGAKPRIGENAKVTL